MNDSATRWHLDQSSETGCLLTSPKSSFDASNSARHILPTSPKILPNSPNLGAPDQYNVSAMSDGVICRICHDGDAKEALISPCRCSGTMGLVHRSCMERWLAAAGSSRCELCCYQLSIRKKSKVFRDWLRDPASPQDHKNIRSDFICFLMLTPLAGISCWLCISGAAHYGHSKEHTEWEAFGLMILAVFLLLIYVIWCFIALRYHYRAWIEWRRTHQDIVLELSAIEAPGPDLSASIDDNNNILSVNISSSNYDDSDAAIAPQSHLRTSQQRQDDVRLASFATVHKCSNCGYKPVNGGDICSHFSLSGARLCEINIRAHCNNYECDGWPIGHFGRGCPFTCGHYAEGAVRLPVSPRHCGAGSINKSDKLENDCKQTGATHKDNRFMKSSPVVDSGCPSACGSALQLEGLDVSLPPTPGAFVVGDYFSSTSSHSSNTKGASSPTSSNTCESPDAARQNEPLPWTTLCSTPSKRDRKCSVVEHHVLGSSLENASGEQNASVAENWLKPAFV